MTVSIPFGPPAPYSLYLLLCKGGVFYTGIALDVAKRYQQHAVGKGAKFTRANPPSEILFQRKIGSLSDALKLEHQVKKLPKAKKLSFLQALAYAW